MLGPSKIRQINNVMMYKRSYKSCGLKSIVYTKCLSLGKIYSIIISLSEILVILCECDTVFKTFYKDAYIYTHTFLLNN